MGAASTGGGSRTNMSCIVVKLITSLPQGSREAQAIYLCLGVGRSVGAALAPPHVGG